MKTPINLKSIREHWHYAWWKYLLLVCLTIFSWSMIYTVTAYRPPAEKKVDMYICGYGDQEALDAYMEQVRTTQMNDMEQMSAVILTIDETYTPVQLMTYISAGEGDIYVLPKEYFQSYAASDGFLHLEDMPDVMAAVEETGISVSRGWRVSQDEGRHLYGIPAADLPGLSNLIYAPEESFLSIIATNGNDENSAKFLSILIRDMAVAPVAEPAVAPVAEPAAAPVAEPAADAAEQPAAQ